MTKKLYLCDSGSVNMLNLRPTCGAGICCAWADATRGVLVGAGADPHSLFQSLLRCPRMTINLFAHRIAPATFAAGVARIRSVRQSTRTGIVLLAVVSVTSLPLTSAHADATTNGKVTYLNSGKVVPPNLPFSEAVRVGNLLYLSGQIGVARGERQPVPGGIAAETKQAMDNIRTVLEIHGYTMNDLVKCTAMLADITEWSAFNEVYKTYFNAHFPARSALGANGLALGARVEIECIAAVSTE